MRRNESLSGVNNVENLPGVQGCMNSSGKRIIVACLLTAALGLILFPPWRGTHYIGHRPLWNGRGNPDWSRLALEVCLVAVICALAAVVAPMAGRLSATTLKVWFRRAGLVFGSAAVLILAATAGYDAIVRFALLRNYNQSVREFQAKTPLLQEAFPLDLSTPATTNGYQVQWDNPISNVHEAELMLRSLNCDDRSVQRAMARFLSASTPEYNNKTLTFAIGTAGEKQEDCPPKEDIFDQIATNTKAPKGTLAPPPGFDEEIPVPKPGAAARRTAAAQSSQITDSDVEFATSTATRKITFEFPIRDSDAAKRFFAPLPDWHTEALQHKIEVDRVPDWMKPGEPPAPWSFGEWLESRSSWVIPAAVLLALSALCFVAAIRINRVMPTAKAGVGGVRA